MFKFSNFLLILLAASAMGGCDSKDKADSKVKTQVAAKVNGTEITVHQINFALQRMNLQNETQAKEASKQALRGLVEQEMLYQKALEAKLDRDPQAVQALEFSRRQYLAQAYMSRQVKPVQPDDTDIKAYYMQHPELFAQRRIFNLQEITAQMKPDQQADLQKVLEKPVSMDQIVQWFKSRNIQFTGASSARAPEQMPPEYLKRISQLQKGQIGSLRSENGVMLVHMLGFQPQAVSEAQAKPAIARFLANQKSSELASAEMKKVRDTTKIEYLGAYVDLGKEPPVAQAKTANEAQTTEARTAVPPPATSEGSPAKAAEKPNAKAMERGLSGL